MRGFRVSNNTSLKNFTLNKENNSHAEEPSRNYGLSFCKAFSPVSSFGNICRECPSRRELPVPGHRWQIATTHQLAQPVVLWRACSYRGEFREGRQHFRRRNDRAAPVHAEG